MNLPSDLITATEARKLLGVSPLKMSKMLRDGTIRHFPDPLDERKKLVSKSEILSLIIPRVQAA
jgi:hypothetical protein